MSTGPGRSFGWWRRRSVLIVWHRHGFPELVRQRREGHVVVVAGDGA